MSSRWSFLLFGLRLSALRSDGHARTPLSVVLFALAVLVVSPRSSTVGAEDIRPFPPGVIIGEKVHEWSFEDGAQGWQALHDCRISAGGGVLKITSTGTDPYLAAPVSVSEPGIAVRLRARCAAAGKGQFFWTTTRHPHTGEARSRRFELIHDHEWHDYEVLLDVKDPLTSLRLDPGGSEGVVEVERIAIHRGIPYPLEIARVEQSATEVVLEVHNHRDSEVVFTANGKTCRIPGSEWVPVAFPADSGTPFEAVTTALEPRDLPPLRHTVVIHRQDAPGDFIELEGDTLTVAVSRDGTGARIFCGGVPVGVFAPLVLVDGRIPSLEVVGKTGQAVTFEGEDIWLDVRLQADEIFVSIRAGKEVEGPVLRAVGALEQGLFAGVEYLGRGEASSSKLDIETEDHLRFAPDPLKVTLPLMSVVTDRSAVALTWKDTSLQPVFATPNFIDGSADHRMALRGSRIEAVALVRRTALEETILWAVQRFGGLPPPPRPPRSRKEQSSLCMKAIQGPIAGPGGWGHCAEDRWPRRPHADIVSTIWRLTGTVPELPGALVPGGAHVRNEAAYFVTGNAPLWLEQTGSEARGLIQAQQPDGGYLYRGPYRRGHFEDTASGVCARPAARLLELAHLTGNREYLAAGVKTLEYMKRFRTPRGAQTWELSLHTPDVLASAYLVWAYVRGYELTGNEEYLGLARKWALTGVPFVYLWSRYPIMLYATPPVYGATNYRAPLWIGLPVQWCGGVYAYALTLLAPHDETLEWSRLARGILVAGQQMQYPQGPLAGCLPDVFELASQSRAGPTINPAALVSLQLALEGKPDSLVVATGGGHRVAAPFPVRIEGREAHIDGHPGASYQVLVDGEKVVDVKSRGSDVVPVE